MTTTRAARGSTDPDVLEVAGFSIDVHDLTVLVPLNRPAPPGTTIALEIRGREGLRLRAVGRVESSAPEGVAPAGTAVVRLLDVRPLHEQRILAMESLRPPSVPPGLEDRPLRVLVVDDDRAFRRSASGAMRAAGYEVAEASNGAEALKRASGEGVDLILTDVNMPVMDGWQLLRLLRARDDLRHLPVIFLTTLQSEGERMKGYAQGVDDYVDKPFEIEDLTERVERLLKRRGADSAATLDQRALRGDLQRVSLGSLLSFLESDRHTGLLRLDRQGQRGELRLSDGFVHGVTLSPDLPGDSDDLQRLFHMLDWSAGRFELLACTPEGEDELGLPTSYILLEHARQRDTPGATDPG